MGILPCAVSRCNRHRMCAETRKGSGMVDDNGHPCMVRSRRGMLVDLFVPFLHAPCFDRPCLEWSFLCVGVCFLPFLSFCLMFLLFHSVLSTPRVHFVFVFLSFCSYSLQPPTIFSFFSSHFWQPPVLSQKSGIHERGAGKR